MKAELGKCFGNLGTGASIGLGETTLDQDTKDLSIPVSYSSEITTEPTGACLVALGFPLLSSLIRRENMGCLPLTQSNPPLPVQC